MENFSRWEKELIFGWRGGRGGDSPPSLLNRENPIKSKKKVIPKQHAKTTWLKTNKKEHYSP